MSLLVFIAQLWALPARLEKKVNRIFLNHFKI